MSHFPHAITLRGITPHTMQAAQNWCKQQFGAQGPAGWWRYENRGHIPNTNGPGWTPACTFHFRHTHDAVSFQLAWCF
jgi:hypothetical protein